MSYNGEFTNPAGNDIVINTPAAVPAVHFKEMDGYYLMTTDKVALRAYLKPLRLSLIHI